MFRQSPGRNQRSKGIKMKHVLQLCFLIAICFWLLYQVKHSHDKKKEFDESDAKVSVSTQTANEMLKFGRKDLQQPKVDEIATTTVNKKQNEEAEEEEEEQEENKHEEVQQEEEQKFDDKEDEEGKGVGEEDELPEHEQEKSDPEIDREEDATEEEKDKEEGDEKETEENETEDNNGQLENESSMDDHDDEDGTAKGTHEAREELYKADDASSAVTHETQISADETDNEDSNEHLEMDKSANETEKNTIYSKTQEREMIENNHSTDTIPNNIDDNVESKSENSSMVAQSDDHAPVVKNTNMTKTEVIREADGSSIQNGTETGSNLSNPENVAVDGKPPGGGSNMQNISLDQNDKSILNSGNHEEDPKLATSAKTEEMDSSSEETSKPMNSSSTVTGSDNITESENLDSDDGTSSKENDAVKIENPEVQNDPIDSSDSSVAVRTDLETLPEIQAEANNDEDAAAE